MGERRKRIETVIKRSKWFFKKVKSFKRQSVYCPRLKGVSKENKPCKYGIYTESLEYEYYFVFFEFLTLKELRTKRHFLVQTV